MRRKQLKSLSLLCVNLVLNVAGIMLFISIGLYLLGELRESYLWTGDTAVYYRSAFHIGIRYVSYLFFGALLLASYFYTKQESLHEVAPEKSLRVAFDFFFFVPLLCVLSAELINWMDIFGYKDSYRLGLSILWGIYALLLIVLGIYLHKKDLRIGAIALFGITLVKLFFFDLADLSTIAKTIVFVSLGILLLIVSFLYNKYKHLIFDDEDISEVS